MAKLSLGTILVVVLASTVCVAQADTNVYRVTSPIQPLEQSQLGADISANPLPDIYKSGLITPEKAADLLTKLKAATNVTTIIHVLRWKDQDHTTVDFQKWYLYDPTPSKTSFYLQSKQQVFERTAIPGRKDFQFVYIHLNADLSAGAGEWSSPTADPNKVILAHSISYAITVTKQQTQFLQDLNTLLQILGLKAGAAAAAPQPGYYSITTFQSQWDTSSIQIAASLQSSTKQVSGKGDNSSDKSTPQNQLASNTYHNEKPSYVGLSAGVPITSYKDITYQESSGTLIPHSITQQNVYIFLDFYYPPVLPTLTSFRWLPHPFYGLPLKGEVFRHQMVGAGIGLHWLEPFGGFIFDTQNKQVTGPTTNKTQLTVQAVFGLKVSLSAVAKAIKK